MKDTKNSLNSDYLHKKLSFSENREIKERGKTNRWRKIHKKCKDFAIKTTELEWE